MTIKMFGHASRRLAEKCAGLAGLFGFAASSGASAAGIGKADPGQIGFQEAVTDVARDIHSFHDYLLLPIITVICLFVLALLIAIVVKFNDKTNPVASKTTHHTGLEVAWTIIPVMILVVIAIPSFKLLTKEIVIPKADVTLKVTGKQWYWSYEYPKALGAISFDSNPLSEADAKAKGVPFRLAVNNPMVVPAGKTVQVLVTGADVLHSFFIPAFGVQSTAVPGKLNTVWFKAEKPGVYYGECNELCGVQHYFMPIEVDVKSQADFDAWVASKAPAPTPAAAPAAPAAKTAATAAAATAG